MKQLTFIQNRMHFECNVNVWLILTERSILKSRTTIRYRDTDRSTCLPLTESIRSILEI